MFTNNQVTRLSNPVLNWYQRPISFGAYIICIYIYTSLSPSLSLACPCHMAKDNGIKVANVY